MKKMNKNNLKTKDFDKDGLTDFEEINVYKTDPKNSDTDGDGLGDCDEIKMGFNPLLKDYFIPNKCNNYRPKALRPKRVLFYGFSALIMKAIVVIAFVSMPLSAFLNIDYIAQESKKIVNLTNEIRRNLNLLELNEDPALSQAATWKAQDMAVQQYFAHTGPDGKKLSNWLSRANYNFHFAGENLAMGFNNAEDTVNAWKKSPSHYKNIIDPDFKEIGVGIANGNYNNSETTFVAQYFGAKMPNIEKPVIETKSEIKEIIPSTNSTPSTTKQVAIAKKPSTAIIPNLPVEVKKSDIVNNNVLSEKEDVKNITPAKIKFENDKSIFTKNIINIFVLAPDCKGFSIFVNTEEQISKNNTCSSTEQITLKEGMNIINLETIYQNNEKTKSEYGIVLDTISPEIIDKEKTKISMQNSLTKELIISAEIYLSSDVENASLIIKDKKINLVQDETDKTKWTGHEIIDNSKNIFKPTISATLEANDYAGNKFITDIDWSTIPFKATIGDQYSFAKSQRQNSPINAIFNFAMTYYKIIFYLAIALLLINIFVEIKKQRADIIISSFLLILLMGFLIVF